MARRASDAGQFVPGSSRGGQFGEVSVEVQRMHAVNPDQFGSKLATPPKSSIEIKAWSGTMTCLKLYQMVILFGGRWYLVMRTLFPNY